MSNQSERFISLDSVAEKKFHTKLSKPLKWLIGKFVHVDYLNSVIALCGDGVDFCIDAVKELGIEVEVEGLENVPADGTLYTFASNHPLGGADGLVLAGIIGKKFGEPRIMVNDFLMFIPPFAPFCVPVNKTGGQSRELSKLVNGIYASDHQILMFPSGKCSRKTDGVISDPEWKKNFIVKSIETHRPVVPIHFIGQNTKRFYFIANLFKNLKFNVAMLLLPDELYRARGRKYRVVIGKPIPCETFDSSKTPAQWADYVRNIVYELN